MVRPTNQSEAYAKSEGLTPFSQWVRLTNADTFIAGPFNFAIVNGRKTKDRISAQQWKSLTKYKHLFTNETPCVKLPDYSVHCGQFHTSFVSEPINARIDALLALPSSPDKV